MKVFDRELGKEEIVTKFNNTAFALTAVVFPSANQNQGNCLAGDQILFILSDRN